MIRVWDTSSWTEAQAPLAGHSLTVTCIRFSHSDEWLLTAGRDRSWALFRRDGTFGALHMLHVWKLTETGSRRQHFCPCRTKGKGAFKDHLGRYLDLRR